MDRFCLRIVRHIFAEKKRASACQIGRDEIPLTSRIQEDLSNSWQQVSTAAVDVMRLVGSLVTVADLSELAHHFLPADGATKPGPDSRSNRRRQITVAAEVELIHDRLQLTQTICSSLFCSL